MTTITERSPQVVFPIADVELEDLGNDGPVLASHAEIAALPPGTVIGPRPDEAYTKLPNGTFTSPFGGVTTATGFTLNYNRVLKRPTSIIEVPPIRVTLEMFKQELATLGRGQARVHGVSGAEEALQSIGLHVPEVPQVGMMVHSADRTLIERLPQDSLIRIGNSGFWQGYGLFAKTDGCNTVHQMGGVRYFEEGVMGEIITTPGVEPVDWAGEWTEETEQQIAEFKSEVWKIGVKAKASNSWCGAYEVAMARLGINEGCVIPSPGEVGHVFTDPAEVRALPEGSVLMFERRRHPGVFVLVQRDSRVGNEAGTRRIWQSDNGDTGANWSRYGMRLLHSGEARHFAVPIPALAQWMDRSPLDLLNALPVGTMLSSSAAPGHPEGMYYRRDRAIDAQPWIAYRHREQGDRGYNSGTFVSGWHIAHIEGRDMRSSVTHHLTPETPAEPF